MWPIKNWWKIYFKKNPLQELLSSLNAVISTNESTQIKTGHVIYNPAYTSNWNHHRSRMPSLFWYASAYMLITLPP